MLESTIRPRPITPRQADVLGFIEDYQNKHNVSPSYQEIAEGCGLKSKSQVHGHIMGLYERGAIRLMPGRRRSVQIIDLHTVIAEQVRGAIKAFRAAGYPMPSTSELAAYLETSRAIVEDALKSSEDSVAA